MDHPTSPLRIRCMSYNLNRGKANEDLLKLLFDQDHGTDDQSDLPDLYVLGFQELAGLHLTFTSLTSFALRERQDAVLRGLAAGLEAFKARARKPSDADGDDLSYSLVASAAHGGLGLLVYARDATVFPEIQTVETARTSCGFLGLMNNKGALGVRLTVARPGRVETLTFVVAHLAAHDAGLAARNRDYASIVSRLVFATRPGRTAATFYDSSHLFFMGDLNYRLSLAPVDSPGARPLAHDDLDALARAGRLASLFAAHDTLHYEHAAGRVLVGLREGEVVFGPTYKYVRGGRASELVDVRVRLPGWTDRIFYGSWLDEAPDGPADAQVRLLSYQSVQAFCSSDHKPVYAFLEIPHPARPSADPDMPPVLATRPHLAIDEWRRSKLVIGGLLDKTCGSVLLLAVLLGFGNPKVGFLNLAIAIIWKLART